MAEQDQELFEHSFHHSPVGMALVGPEGQFLKVNASLSEMLGYSSDELSLLDFQTITHEEDLGRDLCHLKELLDGKINSYQMEKRYISKDGSLVWALLSVSLIRKANKEPHFFISQIQDISALKAAQEELNQQSKFIDFWKLSVRLAHEINNPLAIIKLNAKIMKTLDEVDKSQLSKLGDNIMGSVDRISHIVEHLNSLTKPQLRDRSEFEKSVKILRKFLDAP